MCNASFLFVFCNVVSGVTSLCSCQTSGQREGETVFIKDIWFTLQVRSAAVTHAGR